MKDDPGAGTPMQQTALRPRERRGITRGQAIGVIAFAFLGKAAFFTALDRPFGCDCAQFWALPDDPRLNSLVGLDPYSLLHLVFGALLVLALMRLRPRWSTWTLFATVVASSTLWELAENLPLTIRLFNYDQGNPLAYRGDSLLNASLDTVAAVLGAALARPLPAAVVLAAAAAIELALSLWIGDGMVIASLRALGAWG
jgi:hypothetical protein